LNDPYSTDFEPKPEASSLWLPFLYELESRKLKQAKIQLIGPLTANWATQGNFESKSLITKLVFARALSMVRKLHQIGVQAVIFIDEPGLYVFDPKKVEHQATFSELKLLIQALKKEGAQTGIHCCSNTHWDEILKIPSLDWLSFDSDLSLHAILKYPKELVHFIENENGKLAIGLIPTGSARISLSFWNIKDAIQTTQALLNTVLSKSLIHDPNRVLLTPACGLVYSSIHDSEVILGQLQLAQKLWGEQNR
jgi:methionine synthase II (cobalamin-independent)